MRKEKGDGCFRCDGSGWLLDGDGCAYACRCLLDRRRRRRDLALATVVPGRYRGVRLDQAWADRVDPPATVEIIRNFVSRLEHNLKQGHSLWLVGPVGTGKTQIAMAVSQEALDRDLSVAIYSMPTLLSTLRETYAQESRHSYLTLFRRLGSVDLLHIDDLGAEKQTDWVLEQLYSLINERYQEHRSLLITTNDLPDELEKQIGERAVSRLMEMCGEPLPVQGGDVRWQKGLDPAQEHPLGV